MAESAPKTEEEKDSRLYAALSYFPVTIIGLIVSLYVIFTKKGGKYARFHAIQALIVIAAIFVIGLAVQSILFAAVLPGMAGSWIKAGKDSATNPFAMIINVWAAMLPILLLGVVWFVLLTFLAYKAYTGKGVKLPLIGEFAEKSA
ncbi:MAG: hypothetical protein QW568_01540 [Candidatus Anstonellaceae archaeon]